MCWMTRQHTWSSWEAEFAETLGGLWDRLPRVREVVVLGGDGDEYEKWLAAAEPVTAPYASAFRRTVSWCCTPRVQPAGRRA